MFLSGYNYTIEYIRSADNSADYLSRASLPDNANDDSTRKTVYGHETSDSDSLAPIEDRASYVNFVIDGSLPITLNEIREGTIKDSILGKVVFYITNGWPRRLSNELIKPYFHCKTQLSYENGCVMRGHKIVIPESMRNKLLGELHKSHLGIVKTKAEARSRFWFPGIDKAIENMIASCAICLQLRQSPARAPLALWPHPPQPFYRIHIDFLGPIHNRSYLVIVDAYSKWVEAYDMGANTSTSAVVSKLYEYMARFGLPHTLVSDNGTQFTSKEFKQFCLSNGISHVTSPAYHPASNGQAESYVKVVKKGIKSCILSNNNVKSIAHKMCKYLFDYRNSVHSTTGCSPAQLVFGHKLRSRLDIIKTIQPPMCVTLAQHVENKQCLQSNASNTRRVHCFKSGDYVLYKKYNSDKQGFWNKGVIVEQIGIVVYIVKDSLTSCKIKKHQNQIIPYKGTGNYFGHELGCFCKTTKKSRCIDQLLSMLDCHTSNTPMKCKLNLTINNKSDISIPYQCLIGSLMYLSVLTRPDISYSVSYMCQFNNCFTKEHWRHAKRILRYLKNNKHYAFKYDSGQNSGIVGYVDADWGSDVISRRSCI
ncbi:uncharacterized protein K02A2.6-like [Trichoplusia ni]|uniref:RNA-directed DNA polymerase n=1 Tax=Trichoplusia ni TaxID=7111 RepID=A0A7E5W382_TRINI|nr:uncharacterized protein K02A2.6-like [Trichoplusia ni]